MASSPTARALATLPGAALATCAIPDESAPPDATLLTALEREHFATLSAARRRAEWWAGRVTVRAALRTLGAPELSILPDPRGVPKVVGDVEVDAYHVSISHGRRVAAGSATARDAHHPCLGIDVLDPEDEPRIAGIGPRFLTAHERALVAEDPRAGLLAWGTREAIAKATSTGMFAFALAHGGIRAVDWETRRVTTELSEVEVVFEDVPGDGLVVLAGVSRALAAWAREKAGL